MKDSGIHKTMTEEEILNDSSLSYLHGVVQYVQKNPFSKMFPKKHELSITHVVYMNTKELFIQNPNLPIKKVITTVFEPLTDDIPAPLMLKLTKKIIAQWEKLSKEKNENIAVAAH
jgi:hypothetical protein